MPHPWQSLPPTWNSHRTAAPQRLSCPAASRALLPCGRSAAPLTEAGGESRAQADLKGALEIFAKCEAVGVAGSTRAFNAVLAACGRAGEWVAALDIYACMAQQAVPVDTASYNAVLQVRGCWKAFCRTSYKQVSRTHVPQK
jgi:pentatricopeptide repeat protein